MASPARIRLLACIFFSILAPAQTRKLSQQPLPPEAFNLTAVNVTGSRRFKSEDIVHATGLQLGQTVHDDDFRAAARHLADSGAFSNVAYTFQYSPEGTKLEFQVQDSEKFVPARFENFVWFSDQELLETLRASVPLFDGQLPLAGDLAAQVSEVLQALLLEKKIPGTVDYLRVSRTDGPIEAFAFSITGGSRIVIRNVDFSGAAPPELPLLQSAAKNLKGTEYSGNVLRVQVEKNFVPIYLARGYLRAEFGDPAPKVVPTPNKESADKSDEETLVDVSFAVNPGHQYQLSAIEIEGNKAVPAQSIRPLIPLKIGQTADATALDDSIEAIKKLYGTHGYIEASIKPEPDLDDTQFTVKYRITINEGDVFKMGDLEIQGLDSNTTARLQNNWAMHGGDVYDSSYPRKFAAQAYKSLLAMGDWKIAIHETVNQKDQTVDVVVRFDPKS